MSYPSTVTALDPQTTTLGSAEIPGVATENQTFALSATTLYEVDSSGNPTTVPLGQSGPFVLLIDSEQILCATFSEGAVEVFEGEGIDGRGYGSTTIAAHNPAAPVTVYATSAQANSGGGGGELLAANNLSDVANPVTALGNLGGAPLTSPELTGDPTAPTNATPTDSSTQIATDAFVQSAIAAAESVATTIRSTTGPPTVLTTDIVGDFAFDPSAGVMYGPLTGTPVVGQPWINGATSGAVVNGFVGAAQQVFAPAGGFETLPKMLGTSNTCALTASGDLMLMGIWLPAGFSVGHINFQSQGGAVTPTNQWAGLYDNNFHQLAVSADGTTTAIGGYSTISKAIATIASGSATAFVTTYSGLHYIGLMIVAGTMPTFYGGPYNVQPAPIIWGTSDTAQTTVPAFPHTATSPTADSNPSLYAWVTN